VYHKLNGYSEWRKTASAFQSGFVQGLFRDSLMPQVIRCPHCAQMMQVPDNSAGKQVQCPKCRRAMLVGSAPVRQPVTAASPSLNTAPSKSKPPANADKAKVSASHSSPSRAAPPASSGPASAYAKERASSFSPTSISPLCPACKAALLPGAIACLDCGFLLQNEASSPDLDAPPNLCSNPACGVANAPGERICQRCGNPLPTSPGTVLHGRYRIEKLLAIGGFGAVYLAIDQRQGNRRVAIKDMICADPAEFAIRLNFFRREAEILRLLQKSSVVPQFYDLIEHGQTAHVVMEYIRGQDLLKKLETNDNKPFPVELVVEWAKSICDVLTQMHRQSPPLIHRDLKPDNIMLMEDGRSIKMIDFGTARDLGRTAKDRVSAKTRVYTEGYAPPEQIIGKPEPRSDLFALAGTLYQLVTGHSPEGFYTARELAEQLKDSKCPFPVEHRWFYDLVRINLAEDVKDRYFSAREIKADLDKRQVSTEIHCAKCGEKNAVRSPYCSRCAEALTDPAPPCAHCGKINRMGSRYCIHCGNSLR
jgi:predicted Ser/Thr protein kinase